MSMWSKVSVGYYLVCRKKTVPDVTVHQVCSAHPKLHDDIQYGDKFCSECGAAVVDIEETNGVTTLSLNDFTNDYEWCSNVPEEDVDWLHKNFTGEYLHNICWDKEEFDVLTVNSMKCEESTFGVVCDVDLATLQPPSAEDIQRLTSIMQYLSVEVKFGAIVSVSF